ncbi:DUF3575 domain-containing protein [Flavobacterium sp. SUN052]|uniref:DUF3575 domain-containing protein n=1 Tax=Flavobacterium sp. SUN052 TaxID=3002441 RepID=UPI00237D3D00|nr:DUF3575 domain-containing protein [Flavobacterium sp. SUN052]MEC4004217.1 DUF3575 domain-containing protein [Flavobacterium sp. SUN052]
MKKIAIALLLTVCLNGFSQNEKKEIQDFKKNEIKVNALYLILGAFDATYERAINEESSVGSSVTFLLDKEGDINTAFAISPYYRFYFGGKPVSGFFMEGFSLYQKVNRNTTYYTYDPTLGYSTRKDYEEKVSAFALGIGLGGKWYTKRNVMFEISAGIGRNLSISSNVPDTDYSRITGKFGITVGYRF